MYLLPMLDLRMPENEASIDTPQWQYELGMATANTTLSCPMATYHVSPFTWILFVYHPTWLSNSSRIIQEGENI